MTYGQPPVNGMDTFRRSRDRPWLVRPPTPVDHSRIRQWQAEVDQAHRTALPGLDPELPRRWSDRLAPGISVVVLAPDHPPGLDRCLRSLAGQTLDRTRFEIIVVLTGPPGRSAAVLAEIRRTHPSVTLRVIRLSAVNAARAAGMAAASRRHTSFVDGADRVSPRFLAALLTHAAPGRVPVAATVDSDLTSGEAPASPVGKLVPTDLLQELWYEQPDLAGQDDPVFWLTVLVRGGLQLQPGPASDGAVYYRQTGSHQQPGSELRFEVAVARQLDQTLRLEELTERADVGTRRLLRDQVGASADRIGEYLRKQPADHGQVVAALDQRPIFYFPYHRMNGDRARSLAIAYAFPPYIDTSAVVTAKRVRARGELVDVVSNAMDRIRDTDDSLRRISGPFVAHVAAVPTASYFSDWAAMEQFSLAGLDAVDEWVARKGPYRHVYSRAHFAASHYLAAAYKVRNPQVSWRAEFSDPLSRDVSGHERGTRVQEGALLAELRRGLQAAGVPAPDSRNCFVWCEALAYALADELVFTNSHQLEYMLAYCSNQDLAAVARAKAVISPQPTLPPEFYAMADLNHPLEAGATHLAYFGNFYATRGLDDVLAALSRADAATRARLRVHVFTAKPAELGRRARELGVSGLVRVGPYVRYLEFLNLTTRFDCLIVNDAVTTGSHACNPYLPSKWSDYRGSGTPVWGLVEEGSQLSRLPLDYCSPIGDVEAASGVLSLIADREPRSHRGRSR